MQYIGARYVPKFMGTYDNTQAYENMCVVDNGLGTSYISVKPTPAGTPLTDTDYWAIYGASNGAIINLQNQIGDLTNLSTSDQSSLVNAINEVDGDVQTLTTSTNLIERLRGKKIMIFGDSISDQDWSGSGADPTGKVPVWVDYFEQALDGIATVTNNSEVGRRMIDLPGILDGYLTIDADIVIVELGTNDFHTNVQLGNYSSDATYFAGAVGQSFVKIGNKTGKNAEIWFITPFTRNFEKGMNTGYKTVECYRQCIIGFMKHYGGCWINGDGVPRYNAFFNALYDGIHPRTEFTPYIADYILKCLESYNCNIEFNDVAYYGDLASIVDDTKFDMSASTLHYHMEGQKMVIEGFLMPLGNALSIGDAIVTASLGDLLQLNSPNRYQPAALFVSDSSNGCAPAFIFNTGGLLYWRTKEALAANAQQLSFRYEYLPSWCNVYTDGMS